MIENGTVLYLLLAAILFLLGRAARKPSLNRMFDLNVRLHEHVHRVLKNHPGGGTWKEHKQWMTEADAPPAELEPVLRAYTQKPV